MTAIREIQAQTRKIADGETARATRRAVFLRWYGEGTSVAVMAAAAGLTPDAVRKQMWPPKGIRPKHSTDSRAGR